MNTVIFSFDAQKLRELDQQFYLAKAKILTEVWNFGLACHKNGQTIGRAKLLLAKSLVCQDLEDLPRIYINVLTSGFNGIPHQSCEI